MASLPLKRRALVPERSQLDVEHAQRGDDNHEHVDIDRRPKPTRSQAGNRPQSALQSPRFNTGSDRARQQVMRF